LGPGPTFFSMILPPTHSFLENRSAPPVLPGVEHFFPFLNNFAAWIPNVQTVFFPLAGTAFPFVTPISFSLQSARRFSVLHVRSGHSLSSFFSLLPCNARSPQLSEAFLQTFCHLTRAVFFPPTRSEILMPPPVSKLFTIRPKWALMLCKTRFSFFLGVCPDICLLGGFLFDVVPTNELSPSQKPKSNASSFPRSGEHSLPSIALSFFFQRNLSNAIPR